MEGSIVSNVEARKAAEEIIALTPTVLDGVDERRFWEALATHAAARCGMVLVRDVAPLYAMVYEEALRFEQEQVPSGPFKGELVGDVEPKHWLRTMESDFCMRLRRYMMSQRFREVQ